MAAEGDAIEYLYTAEDPDVIVPRDAINVTVVESATVIWFAAFREHPKIATLFCHVGVETIEDGAFYRCRCLRRVILLGVREIETAAFGGCDALTDVECGKLEIIGRKAFCGCKSLRIINLPSAKIVQMGAFVNCEALTDVKFGKELETIGYGAFNNCTSLQRITIPLKDGIITHDIIFNGCGNLKHVDLVEGAILKETVTALQLEDWRNDMNVEIDAINQILSLAPTGTRKARMIQTWIRAVVGKIVHYKIQHSRLLNEAATSLELALLPKDIVIKNVLPFLELPSHAFEGEE
eukprot:scaffold3598_cov148-Skeletonema_dohrnii-CCMP3373.AAC.16